LVPELILTVELKDPVVALTVPPDWLVAVVAVVALVADVALPLKAPEKVGAVTVPANFAAPSEDLISATIVGVTWLLVPDSNVQPYPAEFSIKLRWPQLVTSVPVGAVIFAYGPHPVAAAGDIYSVQAEYVELYQPIPHAAAAERFISVFGVVKTPEKVPVKQR